MEDKHLTNQLFTAFELPDSLTSGLADAGFVQCTPIQAETLPAVLAGTDVAAQAPTGTGKTAAFLLGVMNRLLNREAQAPGQPRAVILAPTRELALQIHRDAESLAAHTGLRVALAYGGTGYTTQREILSAGTDILVATPGRMIDFFKQKVFRLDAVEALVIDEADRMFDLGFIRDIRYLLRRMPQADQRLNLMFSATLSYAVLELAYEHMNEPVVIKVAADKLIVDNVTEQIYFPGSDEKIPLLIGLLRHIDSERSLVFINTKHAAGTIHAWLSANGSEVGMMTGDVPQPKREQLLRQFTQGKLRILVATDVAARGLHIPQVSHVINYDLPNDPEDYVHRIGRTARAGASGDAISFACERYAYSFPGIEAYIGHKIPRTAITDDLLAGDLKQPSRRALERPRGATPERRTRPRNKPPRRNADRTRDKQPPAAAKPVDRRSTPAAGSKPAPTRVQPPNVAKPSTTPVEAPLGTQKRPRGEVETPAIG